MLHDFRLLWLGETISNLGNAVTNLALPLVAVEVLHANAFAVSVLYATGWLPWLVIGLPAGAWVDRVRRRGVMLVCDVCSFVFLLSVPVSAWLGVLTLGQLVVVALATGVSSVFFVTAYSAYLPALLGAGDLVEGNMRLQASRSGARIAGPGLAGVLAQAFGAATGLLADAVSFLVSAGCLLAIRTREPVREARPDRRLVQEIRDGLGLVVGDPYFRVLLAQGAVGNLALTGWQAVELVFLVRVVGVNAGVVGGLFLLAATGGVVGAVLARRLSLRLGSARALLLAALSTAPFALLVPLTARGPRLSLFVVGGFAVGTGTMIANVIARSFRQAYCPPAALGRLTATMNTIAYGAIPLGALLAGTLATLLGVRTALWIMTAALVGSAALLLLGPLRHHRDLPGPASGRAKLRRSRSW